MHTREGLWKLKSHPVIHQQTTTTQSNHGRPIEGCVWPVGLPFVVSKGMLLLLPQRALSLRKRVC